MALVAVLTALLPPWPATSAPLEESTAPVHAETEHVEPTPGPGQAANAQLLAVIG